MSCSLRSFSLMRLTDCHVPAVVVQRPHKHFHPQVSTSCVCRALWVTKALWWKKYLWNIKSEAKLELLPHLKREQDLSTPRAAKGLSSRRRFPLRGLGHAPLLRLIDACFCNFVIETEVVLLIFASFLPQFFISFHGDFFCCASNHLFVILLIFSLLVG